MSTQPKPDYVDEELSEQAVHDYLAAHPDFFERNARLLGSLHLPHSSGGTVSLVERQVSMLRQKDLKRERQLKELISVARANDLLAAKIHELALQLMAAGGLHATVKALEEAMRSGFGADQAVLVIFGDPESFTDIDIGRFFRVVARKDAALKPFETFLDGSSARCGQIRDSQREVLFRDDAEEIGSAALVPIGKGAEIGFLAVGSVDSDRFHPGMSIDFLTRLGELIASALKRY
ncbi:MAG: DUF484 family protein [Gammaproteobacteria bacterium]|nr:DUF484 family protein [Gammaproteobacteria bacterium]NNC57108.1 DUF484 family protein [Woeseiaceae bacterium]NNL50843.1 DUF484 family protein [Woeseiaceae bacterium]